MQETFKAEERTIRYMFSNNKKYKVPRNQREYVWTKDNLEDLWDDIFNTIVINDNEIIEKKEYFIGSCVVMDDKKSEYSFVIDGQQRLTTLLVLFSAICNKYDELGNQKLFDSTYKYIEDEDDYGNPYFTLSNPYLDPYFTDAILYQKKSKDIEPENKQQRNVEYAYQFFKEKVESLIDYGVDLIELLNAMRDQTLDLKIVEIIVKSEVDGYTVFEILNARGKELEIHDLVKNWCMKKSPSTFPSDRIKHSWDKLTTNIGAVSKSENTMKTFINHYYISRYDKFSNERELYRFTRRKVKSNNVKDFVKDIELGSSDYLHISNPKLENCETSDEYEMLQFFKSNRITQIRPILLSLYYNYSKDNLSYDDLLKQIRKLYNFHSIYTIICRKPGNEVEKLYHDHSSKLYSQYTTAKEGFISELEKLTPSYDEFEASFNEKKYTNKHNDFSKHMRAVKHVLNSVETYLHSRKELKINKYTIEHIAKDTGDNITSMLGNLLPLARKLNENAGNEKLSKKVKYYKDSSFKMVESFLKYNGDKDEWLEENIKKKTNLMAKLCYESIWN